MSHNEQASHSLIVHKLLTNLDKSATEDLQHIGRTLPYLTHRGLDVKVGDKERRVPPETYTHRQTP